MIILLGKVVFSEDGGTFARTGEGASIVIFTSFDKIRQKIQMIRYIMKNSYVDFAVKKLISDIIKYYLK